MGMTDKFKGTGVFSAIEFERENADNADKTNAVAGSKTGDTPAEKSKEKVPK